jgi:hypothetical protein
MFFAKAVSKLQKINYYYLLVGLLLIVAQSCKEKTEQTSSQADLPAEETYTVIISGVKVGHLNVTRSGDTVVTDYDYKDNGRGPTIKETIVLNNEGFPVQWDIAGNTTFGNDIKESYKLDGQQATWTDATGEGSAKMEQPSFYVNQSGSPYSLLMQARVLLNSKDMSVEALPAGRIQLAEMEAITATSDAGTVNLKTYAV